MRSGATCSAGRQKKLSEVLGERGGYENEIRDEFMKGCRIR